MEAWNQDPEAATLRQRVLHGLPPLGPDGLWPAQEVAIRNLETSLQLFQPRALIQMATGSGKTFTAANIALTFRDRPLVRTGCNGTAACGV